MSAAETADRLAALEDRLDGDAVPEPHTGPFRDVDSALDALSDAVEALAFAGVDQRVRAREMLRAIRRQLQSVQVTEGK